MATRHTPTRHAAQRRRSDHFDPFFDDPALRSAYVHLRNGDWARLEKALTDPALAGLFTTIISSSRVATDPAIVDRWLQAKGSFRAKIVSAWIEIRSALDEHRSAYLARTVGPGARPLDASEESLQYPAWNRPSGATDHSARINPEDDVLAERIVDVERRLVDLAQDRPEAVDPWIGLIATGRARGLPLGDLRQRFETAHQLSPFHQGACSQYLLGLMKRWGGSSVASLDLARWIEQTSAAGCGARAALPTAHIEVGLVELGPSGLGTYLTHPTVADELTTGLEAMLEAIDQQATSDQLPALNAYVLAVVVQGRRSATLVREAFSRIDNRPTEWPWSTYGPAVAETFHQTQADLITAASRF